MIHNQDNGLIEKIKLEETWLQWMQISRKVIHQAGEIGSLKWKHTHKKKRYGWMFREINKSTIRPSPLERNAKGVRIIK